MTKWNGVHTILITPFKTDLSVDWEGLRRNVRFAAESPAHVLVCLGTQGEFYALSDQEQREVMRITVEETRGRKPVVCGTTAPSTLQSLSLSHYAREIGADAVMMMAPYLTGVSLQGIREHFARVAREVQMPLFVYNSPGRTGMNVPPAAIAQLAEEEFIVGVKQATDSMTDLEETVALAGHKMAVVCGSETMSWPCLMLGMVGFTATAASFMPRVAADIYDAAARGDVKQGMELFYRLSPFRLLGKSTGVAALVKGGMEMVGLAGGPVRPPLRQLTAEDRTSLKGILTDLAVL